MKNGIGYVHDGDDDGDDEDDWDEDEHLKKMTRRIINGGIRGQFHLYKLMSTQ